MKHHKQAISRLGMLALLITCALPLYAGNSKKAAAITLPAELSYTGNYNGLAITATRTLTLQPDGRWQLEYNITQPLVSVQQSSVFSLNNNHITHTFNYTYLRSIFGSMHEEKTVVDMAQHVAHTSGKHQEDVVIKGNELDKLNCQLQLQLDLLAGQRDKLEYTVMNGDELALQQFAVTGEEDLETAIGKLHTLKLERVRSADAKRRTVFWVAPEHGYSIVKITHEEKSNAYTVLINKISEKTVTLTAAPTTVLPLAATN